MGKGSSLQFPTPLAENVLDRYNQHEMTNAKRENRGIMRPRTRTRMVTLAGRSCDEESAEDYCQTQVYQACGDGLPNYAGLRIDGSLPKKPVKSHVEFHACRSMGRGRVPERPKLDLETMTSRCSAPLGRA